MITARAIEGLPEVQPGDDLAGLLAGHGGPGDVVVIAHKVVSKAEGRDPRAGRRRARPAGPALAAELDKDPRHVQAILDEIGGVVRDERVLICRTRHGFVCANAGVDQSNAPEGS